VFQKEGGIFRPLFFENYGNSITQVPHLHPAPGEQAGGPFD
jgi:hypothetical protein